MLQDPLSSRKGSNSTSTHRPGIQHMGDERTGASEGDDEQIKVSLDDIPADIERIVFAVTIDKADERNQNFGQVEQSYIRLVDEDTGVELLRCDLGEDFSIETAVVFSELYTSDL